MSLCSDTREDVVLERWGANTKVPISDYDGDEILVLGGGFTEGGDEFKRESWLRLPKGASTVATAGEQGAKVWIERNHLAETPKAPSAT